MVNFRFTRQHRKDHERRQAAASPDAATQAVTTPLHSSSAEITARATPRRGQQHAPSAVMMASPRTRYGCSNSSTTTCIAAATDTNHSNAYRPPHRTSPSSTATTQDSIDKIVDRVDEQGTDKYAAMISAQPSGILGGSSSIGQELSDILGTTISTATDDHLQQQHHHLHHQQQQQQHQLSISALSSPQTSYEYMTMTNASSIQTDAASTRLPFDYTSRSDMSRAESHTLQRDGLYLTWNDSSVDFYHTKQPYAYCSLLLTGIQVFVLMAQLALCGVAPLDVNPMLGPYPDAISEWGGKNAYFIQQRLQLWRLVTPAGLHVGVLHLLCNAVVQLDMCAFFEREWGSVRWLLVYVLSEVGCVLCSCVNSPDTIAVGSSGALMGLFGAKLAHIVSYTCFDSMYTRPDEESIRAEHLSNLLCSLAVMSVLSFLTYIDWSGHMGGLVIGWTVGMWLFCGKMQRCCTKVMWAGVGLLAMCGGLGAGTYLLWFGGFVETNEELANACEYFRNLYVEDYSCDCYWQ